MSAQAQNAGLDPEDVTEADRHALAELAQSFLGKAKAPQPNTRTVECSALCGRSIAHSDAVKLTNGLHCCRTCEMLLLDPGKILPPPVAPRLDAKPPEPPARDYYDLGGWTSMGVFVGVIMLFIVGYALDLLGVETKGFPSWAFVVIMFGSLASSALLARLLAKYCEWANFRRAIQEFEREKPALQAAYTKAVEEYERRKLDYEHSEAKRLWDALMAIQRQVYDYWPEYPPDWEERRRSALRRDGGKCTKCGTSWQNAYALQAHHEKKLRRGGSNRLENLVTLCDACHAQEPGHEHML